MIILYKFNMHSQEMFLAQMRDDSEGYINRTPNLLVVVNRKSVSPVTMDRSRHHGGKRGYGNLHRFDKIYNFYPGSTGSISENGSLNSTQSHPTQKHNTFSFILWLDGYDNGGIDNDGIKEKL